MRENKTCLDQGWNQLPTEELDRVLQAELEKEHPNEEVVLPILRELEEREKDYPVEGNPEVLTMLDQYSKHETTSKQSKNRRGWIAGIAAIAAVVCIVVMTIPRPAEADSFFDILFRWTESIFEFFSPERDAANPPVDIVFETDNPGLQQLYDKVTEHGVKEPIVPMWLPEGFVLSELKEISMAGGTKIFCKFENGSKDVSLAYRLSTDITASFERKETVIEIFEAAEVNHFILQNSEKLSVVWSIDGVEGSIITNIDKEDVYQTIKSIYRSRLQ